MSPHPIHAPREAVAIRNVSAKGIRASAHAFTLVELLLAMAILAIMAVLMLSVTSASQKVSKQTMNRVEEFRESRRAFERINQRLAQATLNTYHDYIDSGGNVRTTNNSSTFVPYKYARISELRYLQTNAADLTTNLPSSPPSIGTNCVGQALFFQAPSGSVTNSSLSGMNSLLNTVGFLVVQGDDSGLRPATMSNQPVKTRYRVFELTEPSESLTIYSLTSGGGAMTNTTAWFTTPMGKAAYYHRLADNIVALLFQAQYTDTNGTAVSTNIYSSSPVNGTTTKNQPITENNLPPSVRVSMVAVDEPSARRIVDTGISLTNATDDASLDALIGQLRGKNLNYRKFESIVGIGSAKWSAK
jgi:uncharacterized protein (TIGR02599 family)